MVTSSYNRRIPYEKQIAVAVRSLFLRTWHVREYLKCREWVVHSVCREYANYPGAKKSHPLKSLNFSEGKYNDLDKEELAIYRENRWYLLTPVRIANNKSPYGSAVRITTTFSTKTVWLFALDSYRARPSQLLRDKNWEPIIQLIFTGFLFPNEFKRLLLTPWKRVLDIEPMARWRALYLQLLEGWGRSA